MNRSLAADAGLFFEDELATTGATSSLRARIADAESKPPIDDALALVIGSQLWLPSTSRPADSGHSLPARGSRGRAEIQIKGAVYLIAP